MGVRVSGRGIAAGQRVVLRRVQEVAPRALRLVESYMGRSAGRVELMVVDLDAAADLIVAVHQELLGTRMLPMCRPPLGGALAWTTVASSGSLVLLDAVRLLEQPEEVAPTVVHEFAHAVQYARPVNRERAVRHLGFVFDLVDLDEVEMRRAERARDRDEREAEDMEFLADRFVGVVA